MNLIQNTNTNLSNASMSTASMLAKMNKYMFTNTNMKKYSAPQTTQTTQTTVAPQTTQTTVAPQTTQTTVAPQPTQTIVAPQTIAMPIVSAKPFTPFQKDKLFWCFYIILNGYEEYEINRSSSFSIEKQIKIETVEKLKSIKEKLKELKLKRTELEDELVNKPTISIKGLYALCLVHNVSITYIYGRKYCVIAPDQQAQAEQAQAEQAQAEQAQAKRGIIIQNEKKEDSLRWINDDDDFLTKIKQDYWHIENVQKPLKAPSAYTLPELQEIANKLQISTHVQVNEKSKAKVKTALYEEILQTI